MHIFEFVAYNAFWLLFVVIELKRQTKQIAKATSKAIQAALYQDRQIRNGNVGRLSGIDSGRGSGTSGR